MAEWEGNKSVLVLVLYPKTLACSLSALAQRQQSFWCARCCHCREQTQLPVQVRVWLACLYWHSTMLALLMPTVAVRHGKFLGRTSLKAKRFWKCSAQISKSDNHFFWKTLSECQGMPFTAWVASWCASLCNLRWVGGSLQLPFDGIGRRFLRQESFVFQENPFMFSLKGMLTVSYSLSFPWTVPCQDCRIWMFLTHVSLHVEN